MTFLGALPARFRRERVLIIGCGDVGQRAARELGGGRRVRLLALTSNPDNAGALRGQGITPLIGNLDRPAEYTAAVRAAAQGGAAGSTA